MCPKHQNNSAERDNGSSISSGVKLTSQPDKGIITVLGRQ